jgi:hypothetical protein
LLAWFVCTDIAPCPLLDNLLQCVHSDEFDLQQEALFALEQGCLDAHLLQLLVSATQTAHSTSTLLAPLAQELERLLRVPSAEVPLCVVRIIAAITDAHSKECVVSGNHR